MGEELNLGRYTKFIVPLIGAALTAFIAVNGTGSPLYVGLSILVAVVTAYGVYEAENQSEGFFKYSKFWVGLGGTLAQGVLAVVGVNGDLSLLDSTQVAIIGLALISAAGIKQLPNRGSVVTKGL